MGIEKRLYVGPCVAPRQGVRELRFVGDSYSERIVALISLLSILGIVDPQH